MMRRYILLLLSVGSLVGIAGGQQPQPQSLGERPLVTKQGTVDCGLVEFTSVVFDDWLYRFESVHAGEMDGQRGTILKKEGCWLRLRADRD